MSSPRRVSTGKGCPNTAGNPCPTGAEAYCTPTGNFTVGWKGNKDQKNSHGDRIAWFVQIVGGVGIHSSWKANGTPLSHGCVRVGKGVGPMAFAKKINDNVNRHTRVHITGKAPTTRWPLSKGLVKAQHWDGCPAPAPPKPALSPPKRARPAKPWRSAAPA